METPLRQARRAKQDTQLEVARALNIDQGHYSRIERGEVQPAPELARRLSSYFGGAVSPMEIIDPKYSVAPTQSAL